MLKKLILSSLYVGKYTLSRRVYIRYRYNQQLRSFICW